MQLPPDLRSALERAVSGVPAADLRRAAAALSQRYRDVRPGRGGPLVRGPADALAYAVTRLPATYAAVRGALGQLAQAVPGLRPLHLLDVGAGPGTAAWAAAAVWPELSGVTLVERDEDMVRLGRRLAADAEAPALQAAEWVEQDLGRLAGLPARELVVAAYVLGEMREAQQDALVDALWLAAGEALVLIEPGTPLGYAGVLRARSRLLAAGARIAAPCPHGDACPMAPGDWCHFAARVERSALHRQAKAADLGHEDEKFAFVAAVRQAADPAWSRVIRHPQVRSGHVRLTLCTPGGIREEVVPRSAGARFRTARDLVWGSQLDDADAAGEAQDEP